jgi:hypothetical protein
MAGRTFLVPIQMNGNAIYNFLANPNSSSPSSPVRGMLWFDTGAANALKVYDGSAFQPLATGGTSVSSLNSNSGPLFLAGTANNIAINYSSSSFTFSLPSTISGISTVSATNFYGAFNGNATTATTASNSASLGGQASTYYAPITNPNFTTGASVANNRIITVTDKFTAASAAVSSSELAGIISDETGTGLLVFNNAPTFAGTVNLGTSVASGSVTTALNSASLNNQPASYYAPIASPNFTTGASVGGAALATQSYVTGSAWNNTTASVNYATNAGSATNATNATNVISGGTVTTGVLTATTGSFSSNFTASTGTTNLGTTNTAALTSTTGSFSSTLGVSGTSTLGAVNAGALTATSASLSGALTASTGTTTLGTTNVGSFTATSGTVGGNTIATLNNNLGQFATGGNITPANIITTGDVTVGGTLYLSGSTTYVSSSITVIQDPMIYLGHDNPTNLWDLGFVTSFTSPQYQHSGLVRDHSLTNTWRLFSGAAEPANASVNFAGASVIHDTLALGSWQIMSGSGLGTVTASITNAGFLTAPSANFTNTLQLNGAGVLTTSSSPNFPAASVGSFAVARKFSASITGTGAATSFPVTHNLGTYDVIVQVVQMSSGPDTQYQEIYPDVTRNSASQVTVAFAAAPSGTTTYSVIVIG